jgi:flagellar assembly protein FliH
MSAKVLSGDGTSPAEPVMWRRVSAEGGMPVVQSQSEVLQAHLEELEREIPQREQQARAAGLREGEAAALEQAVAKLEPVAEQLARTVADLAQSRRKLRREAEHDVVKLALAIARRIVLRELSVDPETIVGVVKAALEKIEAREVDRLRVNPEDAEILRKQFQRLGQNLRLELAADPRLSRGSAVFETARGNMDASVDTQLEEIQRGLVDRIRQWP